MRGLTTAASIWVVSAIGVTVGLGEFVIAVVLTLLVLAALYVMHRLPIHGDRYVTLQLKWVGELGMLADVIDQVRLEDVDIKHRSVTRLPKTGQCHVTLVLRTRKKEHESEALDRLQADQRFDEVSWN